MFEVLVMCISIGLFEEFLYRGIFQNMITETNDNDNNIVLLILLSSLIFGLWHILNLFGGRSLSTVIFQIINTISIGMLIGAIYYTTKNIWAVVCIYAFYNLLNYLPSMSIYNVYNTIDENIFNIINSTIMSLICFLYAIKILHINKENKSNNKKGKEYNIVIIILLVVYFFIRCYLYI